MRSLALSSTLCVFLSVLASGCGGNNTTTGATTAELHTATLAGADETPPTTSGASGSASFTINASSVSYQVTVQNITDVVASHIHSGAQGVAGPVRVTLLATPVKGVTNGVLVQGSFSASDVTGVTYDELLNEIRTGGAYVNVHTVAHPAGEIRGQIH